LVLSVGAYVQEKKPKEVKEETEVKVVKVKDNEKTTENKVKTVTRETANVELDEKDKNKTNQDRVNSISKVEKEVYVDNDKNDNYDFLTKETFYKFDDKEYVFTPITNRGFGIAYNMKNRKAVEMGNSYITSVDGYYIVENKNHSGIGHFDENGNFIVEYYNKATKQVEVKSYLKE